MPNDPILHMLGLAKKAGKLEIGEEPVGAVCRARQARLILLAVDAAPNTCRRAAHFSQAGNVLWLETPFTKAELGLVLGRSSCAMLALTDAGFSAAVGEKLAARDPDKYGPAAQQLREKAERVLQRQREQRQHEKNLRQGKAHPWAPPPVKDASARRSGSRPQKAARRPEPGGNQAKTDLKQTAKAGRAAKGGPARSKGNSAKPGPVGRRLTGTFRKP